MMLDELERRHYTASTRRAYIRIIEEFARHFHRSPDQLGPEHIREYIAHLFREKKLSDNSVHQTVGAFRFFFVGMLKRPWRVEETPYPKKRMHLPVILSRDEVARLIESASNPFHRRSVPDTALILIVPAFPLSGSPVDSKCEAIAGRLGGPLPIWWAVQICARFVDYQRQRAKNVPVGKEGEYSS
jgi:integrase